MEKRKLRKLPFIQAKEEDIELAERGGTLEWIIRAEYMREIPGCLAVYLYCREDLLTGNRTARFRIFLEYGDYISQKSNGGWSKAALEKLVHPSKKENCISADAETEKRICRWMGNPAGKNAAEAISFFQEKVREVRLARRYEKRAKEIDRMMGKVRKIPRRFEKWIDQEFMPESRYFFYRYGTKKEQEGGCSRCRSRIRIDRKLVRYGKKVTCPVCGKELTALSEKKMPRRIWNQDIAVLFQKTEDGLVLRFFVITKTYGKNDFIGAVSLREYARLFFENGSWIRYEFCYSAYYNGMIWKKETYTKNTRYVVPCPVGLKYALKDTPFIYSGLEAMITGDGKEMLDVVRYLEIFQKWNGLEKLAKCGFRNLVFEAMNEGTKRFEQITDKEKTEMHSFLKISRGMFRVLPRRAVTMEALKFVQQYCFAGKEKDWDAVRDWLLVGQGEWRIQNYLGIIPLRKIADYVKARLESMENGYAKSGFIRSYFDYLGWCRKLRYDLRDQYYAFPKNFAKEHDRVMKEYEAYQVKEKERERRACWLMATRRLRRLIPRIGEIKNEKFQIIVPPNAGTISREGKIQHHCVASYIPHVAKGKSLILFLRQNEDPGKPFRTLEWKNGKFKQCQGKGNCAENGEEITDFLEYAAAKLIKRLETKKAA